MSMAQAPRRLLMALVRGYRLVLSPWLGNQCRFEPSCSVYALEALERHGAAAGSYLTVARIARCQPWCRGGCDPVPATFSPFTGLLARLRPNPLSPDDQKSSSV